MLFNIWAGVTIVLAVLCTLQLLFVRFVFPTLFGKRDKGGVRRFTYTALIGAYLLAVVMVAVIAVVVHYIIKFST